MVGMEEERSAQSNQHTVWYVKGVLHDKNHPRCILNRGKSIFAYSKQASVVTVRGKQEPLHAFWLEDGQRKRRGTVWTGGGGGNPTRRGVGTCLKYHFTNHVSGKIKNNDIRLYNPFPVILSACKTGIISTPSAKKKDYRSLEMEKEMLRKFSAR